MTLVERIKALVAEGLYECPDDYWRIGTEHEAHREYNAATRDRLITTGCYGIGRGKRLHLAGIGIPLLERIEMSKV